ncbi:sigma-70 family RNA polymerase sigma factor [Sphaerisporangium sp. B11E5]|uniref:sigma-70 family RNA polymerase sigma factor n=1 Tax=Sphaerisporangium sp. B11E5 TaxID=3153563 RepID=UPI00325E1D37
MDPVATEQFEAGRPRLASLAYRLLGSAADAEDTVQDAFLRWQAADRDRIEMPQAWLTKIVTNLCIDKLRSARTRHEHAAGVSLPEPLLHGDPMLGPADTFEQRESVSLAVLTLMEYLTPHERAVYVLREAFSYSHAEIAGILDITESASQQHLHRARRRVAARHRGDIVDNAGARRIVEAFLHAATSGETERLIALLTEDATGISDGAGLTERVLLFPTPKRLAAAARATLNPRNRKHRWVGGPIALHAGVVNGSPALIAVAGDQVAGLVVFEMREGKIASAYGVASPRRLGRLTTMWSQQGHNAPILESW